MGANMDPDARTRVSESKPDPMVGRTFDGYRIEEILGRGGMGTVYRATQLSLKRAVALKVLTDELVEDAQFLERFHREADALSRLSHPNIVTILERGEVDGRPYLVMEFIEGPNLRQVMREGALPPAEAFRIVSSVLSALQHAHDKGIVHRDIKPENVLLARGDVVKVADFGLSRLIDADMTRLTRTHLVLGTYEYMAPEQREKSKEADNRSDLYATGVVLYEMLTGGLPIGRFALPSSARPNECDARMDRIVERSLDKDPARRYQEAGEMASAVSRVLEHPSAEVPPPAPAARAAQSDSTARYRPARFEHHVDNLATIDQVLGTVCYVLAIAGIFGLLRGLRALNVPFSGGTGAIVLFVMGWYLRETGENLRKYRLSARTSQAVIAIIAAFTGFLLPYTIYSFWVLFGHRGRTYFEARNRGLGENEAARHTYRVIESEFTPPPMPPPPPAAARATRPEQIPVQSMVTSQLESAAEQLPSLASRKKLSRWVKFGMIAAVVTSIVAVSIAVYSPGYARNNDAIAALFWLTIGCLSIGLLEALFRRNVRGLWSVFGLAVVIGGAALYYDYVQDAARSARRFRDESVLLAQYHSFATQDPNFATLSTEQLNWIREATGVKQAIPLRISKSGSYVRAELPRYFLANDPDKRALVIHAAQIAILRAHPEHLRARNLAVPRSDAYSNAKLRNAEVPGDSERTRLWIGTLKMGVGPDGKMPNREEWTLSPAESEWLATITGFRAPQLLRFYVESGLVHASLPKAAFSRDSRGAWLLIHAAQELIETTRNERALTVRAFPWQEIGVPTNAIIAQLGRIRQSPPPGAYSNR